MDVLYLDNHLLVVEKPVGLLVQGDRTGDVDLLTLGKRYIKDRFDKPGNVYLGLVHRLDRPASGVIVLARTSKAAARLSEQFRRRTVDKRYTALIEGELDGGGILRHRLAASGGSVRVVGEEKIDDTKRGRGKSAELRWRSLERRGGLTLVGIRLKTGRKHQIRVQLSAIGHPIVGDFRYGATRPFDGRNLALHCYLLGFEHPIRREWMEFVAPPRWDDHFGAPIGNLVRENDRS